MTITTELITRGAVEAVLDEIATLRLDIFTEFPYLYVGRREEERTYLSRYAQAPGGAVILAKDGEEVIGAVTGMPLAQEDPQMLDAFSGAPILAKEVYYIGELLFRPGYRNEGLGQRLLGRFEEYIRSLGGYRKATCATIMRPEDHPLSPADYIPITRFLARTGFEILPGVTANFAWKENDGVKREHTMQFWSKDL